VTRKGEVGRRQFIRDWPHHVALPAEGVRRLQNSDEVRGVAGSLISASLTYHLTDPSRVVFRFKQQADAEAFAARFGGDLLPIEEPRRRRRAGGLAVSPRTSEIPGYPKLENQRSECAAPKL
jgi:hypothetical protein